MTQQTTLPQTLGQLAMTHELLTRLVEETPEPDCYRSFHPELAPLAWYLGLSVYQETYWLREVIQGDDDLTNRVRNMFSTDSMPHQEQWSRLPPKDHLLNWALEIQDENLKRLANPSLLPDSPMLINDRLGQHILQGHQQIYETMLMVLTQRQLEHGGHIHNTGEPLLPRPPACAAVGISQGHYRIGAKEPQTAYDNELPGQMIQLSNFQIARSPISNSEYLAFMQDDGYSTKEIWTEPGWQWQQELDRPHPTHWRLDQSGHWFGIGINGASDLQPDDPVVGISQHEAKAYANWVAVHGGDLTGAVLQHEYQWEVAIRTQVIKDYGRAWEWCSNSFHPYTDHQPSADGLLSDTDFDQESITLRGTSIHTQRSLRRPSYRNHAAKSCRLLLSGARLVFPPKVTT